jgi:Uma2 family endonuclease
MNAQAQARSSPLATDAMDLYVDIPFRMTTDVFFQSTQHSERQFQLLNGRPIVNPAPTIKHQRVLRRLTRLLGDFVESGEHGEIWFAPCDVVLSTYDVVQPDLFFVSTERAHVVTEKNVQGAPDLVVETLSASTADWDRGYKQQLYAIHGVREYWLVDPDAELVEVLALGDAGYETVGVYRADDTVTSRLLEGLAIPVNDIFGG